MLDPRGVRFTAMMTSVILGLGLLTQSWRIMAAQSALFALCAFSGTQVNPWGTVFRRVLRPKLREIDESEQEEPAPVRFSQLIGLTFALVATVGYAAGWTSLGLTANAMALVAALLNAVFGICLGCHLYLSLRRLATARAVRTGHREASRTS